MACLHKFYEDLYLDRLDFAPITLIVGTFSPGWPASNTAQWFYGRTHDKYGRQNNNFWEVLPRVYGENSLINSSTKEWKQFCKRHRIALTDLIACIDDANESEPEHVALLGSYSDQAIATRFQYHTPVDLLQLLVTHPEIKNIYLTRRADEPFWKRLWQPVVRYVRIHNKYLTHLLTPSGYAFYQHGYYNKLHPEQPIERLADFILSAWRARWHDLST